MPVPGYITVGAEVFEAIAGRVGDSPQIDALLAADRRLTPAELAALEDAARWWRRMKDIAGRQEQVIAARLVIESARAGEAGTRRR